MKAVCALRFLCVLGVAAALAGCASPRPIDLTGDALLSSYLPTGQEVAPPFGFVGFCLRHEHDCEGGTDKPADVALTPDRWSELNTVNDYVNRLPQVTDEQKYGAADYWTYADAQGGDCEDLALEKRRLLIARGWPADALLLTTVKTWNGEGHAVLLVETAKGEFVLDNMNWEIVASSDAPYVWQARQSRERPYIWVDLDRRTFKQVATALPPLGTPVPFVEATRTAYSASAAPQASFSGLNELRFDPHMDVVADSGPPGR
jgi:predicted transglutaminase-like cysteine proteinase